MKYLVIEKRMYEATYLIEADSQKNAEQLNGEIIEEIQGDCHKYDLLKCEETNKTKL